MPATRYTTTVDGVAIAHQVLGGGDLDFVFVNSAFASNVELIWEWQHGRAVLDALAARGRLALFDRRGTGLSDSVSGDRLPTLEARVEDIRAVMDAAGIERAVLYGLEDGAAQCFLFAATYPERTRALIALGAASRGLWSPEAPWLWTTEQWDAELEAIETAWGTAEFARNFTAEVFPGHVNDPDFVRGFDRLIRHSLRRNDALANERMFRDMDVGRVLPLIQAPTLVMHHTDDRVESVEEGRSIAARIPGATFVELPGADHAMLGDLDTIDRFLASLRPDEESFDRVFATVLFTDIVGSTRRAAELGDRAWADLLKRHDAVLRAMLGRYRGVEVDTAGDGFFATFDGPGRAVRCAHAITGAVRALGLEVRAGIHAGEVTYGDNQVRGIAVHIGARVGGAAKASEVLVSQTVKDLVAGSGLSFEDAGEHALKGVPDRWRLYRVVG
jgi:class 3 adenylate cyclase